MSDEKSNLWSPNDVGFNAAIVTTPTNSKGIKMLGMNSITFLFQLSQVTASEVVGYLQGSLDGQTWYNDTSGTVVPFPANAAANTGGIATYQVATTRIDYNGLNVSTNWGVQFIHLPWNYVRLFQLNVLGTTTDQLTVSAKTKRYLG